LGRRETNLENLSACFISGKVPHFVVITTLVTLLQGSAIQCMVKVGENSHGDAILASSILIVDDSPDIRRALRRVFDSKPALKVCGEAVNGRDGVEKAQQLKPDAIVLDMSMPEMDGLQAAKILNRVMPSTPLIMFTNFAADQFLKREVLSAGIRQVVPKPDSQGLVRAVETALAA
jgi:CheY-like chemotaxis protein